MSTNNELLIRLARAAAKAMSPSDADIVTKLCTQLDCALAAARTACGERTAAHSTIEKAREVTNCPQGVDLQDHLKQLVAENVALKQQEPKAWYIRQGDEVTTDPAEAKMWRGIPLVMANIETPATDSILRAAEARGADAFTAKLRRDMEGLDPEIFAYGEVKNALDMAITSSEMFARQLREGKAE